MNKDKLNFLKHNWQKSLSPSITIFLTTLTILTPILSLTTSAKITFNNYDESKIKYSKDRPTSKFKSNEAGFVSTSNASGDQGVSATQEQTLETSPTLPPNKLTIQATGCYYISRISNDGAGGKLYLTGMSEDVSDKLISDNYNNLTTKPNFILLGNFLSGQDLILKITPFYSQSPKTILSTDSSRVKQVNLGNNSYSLSFEDWLDYDFNDIVLKVEKGICEGEGEPEPPSNPEPPTTPTPQPTIPPTQPETPLTHQEKQKRLEEWKRPEPQTPIRPTIPTPKPALPQVPVTSPVIIDTPQPVTQTPIIPPSEATQSLVTKTTLAPTTSLATTTPTVQPLAITGTPLYNECNYPELPYDNWCAQYYNNNPYSGIMSYSENYYPARDSLGRTDYINKDWGYGNPGGVTPSDYFSAKFSKKQWFESGHYKFYTGYDDGMKLVINGNIVIDKWENPAADTDTRIDLPTGWHVMEVYYQEKTGSAKLTLSWELACKTNNNFSDWCVEFYPNKYQTGIPVKPVTRLGDFWDDNWGNNNPTVNLTKGGINSFSGTYLNSPSGISSLPTDNFSGYFTKMHYFPASTFTFISKADDGTEIILDGTRIINQPGCCSETRTDRYLTEGWYLLQVKFREDAGQAAFALRWEYTDSIKPDGRIINPSANYQTITGNNFTVKAEAWDLSTPQSLVSYVDFYAYYDSKLLFLGREYNDNVDYLYSANIDLTKVSSSQNIEFSINITDRAGNVKIGGWGSVWGRFNKNLSQAESLINDGLYNYLAKRECTASCDTEIQFHAKMVLAIWTATTGRNPSTTFLSCQDLNYLQSFLNNKKNSNWYTSDEPKRLFLNAVFVLNERTLMNSYCKNTMEAYVASANFIALSWQSTNNKDRFIYDLGTVFANRPGKNCIISIDGCNAGTVYEEAYHIVEFHGSSGYNYIFDDEGTKSNLAWHNTGGGINFAYAGDSQNSVGYPFIGVNLPLPLFGSNEWWLMFHEAYKKNTFVPPQFYRTLPDPAENGSSWMDLFSSYEAIKLGKDLRENRVSVSTFANEYKNRFSKTHNVCNEYVPRVPIDRLYWDDVTCNTVPTRLKN